VDSELQLLVVEQRDGDRLLVACYAAHPTLLASSQSRLSGDYPAFLERALERDGGSEAFFLSGAVGSMGPERPPAEAALERARLFGEALAAHALALESEPVLREQLDVAYAAAPYRTPVLQARIGSRWRWSPLLLPWLGLSSEGWLSVLRLGDLVLVGAPGDLSGEIALRLKSQLRGRGLELWTTSFNGAYLGYISPDRYYATAATGGPEAYEMITMSWGGPQQKAQLSLLVEAAVGALAGGGEDLGAR
jgi:hypothetical protein